METRQGKIEEKYLKFATNKAAYATFVIDGRKYNTFDKAIIDGFNPGDFVEMEGEMMGAFWTLKTMKKIEEQVGVGPTPAPKPIFNNGAKEYHLSPEEIKCRALESAIEAIEKPVAVPKISLMELADKFVEWIRDGN